MHDRKLISIARPGFCIEHSRVQSSVNMKTEHYHDFYEIYYFLGGEMSYFIENRTLSVKKYDMVLLDRFTYHRTIYRDNDSRERVLITFGSDTLDLIGDMAIKEKVINLFKIKKLSFQESFNKYMVNTFTSRVLPVCYNPSSSAGFLRARLIVIDLLLSLVEMHEEGAIIEDSSTSTLQQKRISEIVNFINSNYSGRITLDMLCRYFFINKYYLCHIFKDITGISIVDFVNNKRLMEAEKLLRYSSHNVTEISEMVGFNSVNHFISLFRVKYDRTPKAFRQHI